MVTTNKNLLRLVGDDRVHVAIGDMCVHGHRDDCCWLVAQIGVVASTKCNVVQKNNSWTSDLQQAAPSLIMRGRNRSMADVSGTHNKNRG